MKEIEPRTKPRCDREDAMAVLKRLRDLGHVAYFAGGCVRDLLLGLEAKDWDVATDAPPDRVRELFRRSQAVGAAFGVILVQSGRSQVEVATFRSDGIYEDGRRPSSVRFTSPEEDAKRRDFTINGLFLDPIENRIIDYVGGREDLAARRLRAIGSPMERFAEDHLRLLRAVRFASRFGLEIEPATREAIAAVASKIKSVSPERIADELRLMLTTATRGAAWKLLWELGLGNEVFRFLPKTPIAINWQRSIFLNLSGDSISFGLALAAGVFCVRMQAEMPADAAALLTKEEISRGAAAMVQALRISNREYEDMSETLGGIAMMIETEQPTVARKKRFLARPTATQSLMVMDAMSKLQMNSARIESLRSPLAQLSKGEVAPPPLLTGDDLIQLGIKPGPAYRQILDALYDAQLEGTISSREEALEMARRLGTA